MSGTLLITEEAVRFAVEAEMAAKYGDSADVLVAFIDYWRNEGRGELVKQVTHAIWKAGATRNAQVTAAPVAEAVVSALVGEVTR